MSALFFGIGNVKWVRLFLGGHGTAHGRLKRGTETLCGAPLSMGLAAEGRPCAHTHGREKGVGDKARREWGQEK